MIFKRLLILLSILLVVIIIWASPWILPLAQTTTTKIQLAIIAKGFSHITDIQFIPGKPKQMVVLEKNGDMILYDLNKKSRKTLLHIPVLTQSERGLLGLAFHPEYPTRACIYTNTVENFHGTPHTTISEWCGKHENFIHSRTILRVEQPYSNHNAGQLLFGADHYLYIPLGDGGAGGDPLGHGQNTQTLLGSILRIHITKPDSKQPYTIPKDNPFINHKTILPEIYAYGFRNPWRASFTPDNQLIVADVGQNKWEEISLVVPGGNHGWNKMEGFHCYPDTTTCQKSSYIPPIFEYDHSQGRSITGGYIIQDSKIPTLQGQYLFADYVTGRIWSLNLLSKQAMLLGQWSMLPATFGRDIYGQVYIADYVRGTIYQIQPQMP